MLPRDRAELDAIRRQCRDMVSRRARLSSVAAVVPLPGVDLGADISLLMEMIPAINRRFGLSPDEVDELDAGTRQLVFVAVTSVGSQLIGRAITRQVVLQLLRRVGIRVAGKSIARFVPLLGQAVAASISYGAMRLLGNAHIDDCYEVALKAGEGRQVLRAELIEDRKHLR